ncbi:MAG: Lin0368 family putative glycerol transporter subunit [Peptostreptococcaceae bacterium]
MTIQLAFTTILGGAVFAFLCNFVWGRLVDQFGAIGGWIAAGMLVGTTWSLNHGMGFVHQSGVIWMDMAIAAFAGGLVCSSLGGGKLSKAIPTICGCIIGGIIAGLGLAFIA